MAIEGSLKSKLKKYAVDINLLKEKQQLLNDLERARNQSENLMILDVSAFKVSLQNFEKTSSYNPQEKKAKFSLMFSKDKKEKKEEEKELSNKILLRETLKKIGGDLQLQQEFEKILKEENNTSCWYFWKDLNKLIEMDRKDSKNFLSCLRKIVSDYLEENSPHQVKFLIFFLILNS